MKQASRVKVKLPEMEIDAKLWKAFQELTYGRDDVIAEVSAMFIESSIRALRDDPDFKAHRENQIDIDIDKWAKKQRVKT